MPKLPKKSPKFQVGQVVKIKIFSKALSPYGRAYNPQFSNEFYVVTEVKENMPIPMYKLKAMDDDEPIEGSFYSNELTAARGNVFKIERVIQERGEGANKEYLVKFLYFGDRWNQWIPQRDITFIGANRRRGAARRT